MGDEEVLDDLSPSAEVAVDMETSHLYEPTCTTATTTTTTSTAAAASHYCQRITVQQYLQEASEYTRHVVRELEQSEDYKIHTQKCHRFRFYNNCVSTMQLIMCFAHYISNTVQCI